MSLDSLKHSWFELRDLGFVGSLYRLVYELGHRSGFYKRFEKIISKKHQEWQTPISIVEWKKIKKNFFINDNIVQITDFIKKLPDNEKTKINQVADKSLNGEILCFTQWFANYGLPINWHLNPVKNLRWPKDSHWSKAMNYTDGGDIKIVWEVNRFPHIYYLVRAYYLTGDSKYVKGFNDQIQSWSEQNPFLLGVNWASGQELAIRLLSWIFGLYNFYQSDEFNNTDFQLILKQIYLHTWHIDHNIRYAYYAVHNNHLIGEALSLYVVGTLFPFMPNAKKWRKKGKKILTGKCLEQFYEDGGYCQLSHNYHRLALHYYVWAVRVGELNDDRFSENIYMMLEKSAYYLYQNIEVKTGVLPNWGSNDGALLNPWTSCDYTDFRPIISIIYHLCGKNSPFPPGAWDEESLWILNKTETDKIEKISLRDNSFINTGIHILRESDNDFCVFRCGTPPDRYGQADQLHLDIFFDSHNIVVDGGSYLYNDELQYHKFFMGTPSHNTIIVDKLDQMLLWRRFKWLFKSKANLINFNTNKKIISGEHFGYTRIEKGLRHRRSLKMESGTVWIKDKIINPGKNLHKYALHWSLDVKNVYHLNKDQIDSFVLTVKDKSYWLYMWNENEVEINNEQIKINYGLESENIVDGWLSRYYGERKKIYSLTLEIKSNSSIVISSIFSKHEIDLKELKSMTI